MDLKTAEKFLSVEDGYDSECVRNAYIERVKEVRNEPDFDKILQELNVARDCLLENTAGGREIVPVLARELTALSAKQTELARINDARDEFKSSFGTIEARNISRIKGARDITGLFSAISGILAFTRENISDLLPFIGDVTPYGQILLLASGILALLTYLANRRASLVSVRMDEIKRQLTRDREISRLLGAIFSEKNIIEEEKFESKLLNGIGLISGVGRRLSNKTDIIEIYGAIGLPVPIRIYLGGNFSDDYIDFLIKSGYIRVSGTSGKDMMFHRMPRD